MESQQPIPSINELLNIYDFHNAMRRKLLRQKSAQMDNDRKKDKDAYNFYMTGVLDEYTLRENERIYGSMWLRPRILSIQINDKQPTNTRIALFGGKTKCALPIYISATSRSNLVHKRGEIEILKAAYSKDIIYMIPSLSSIPLEDVFKSKRDQSIWFQLYTFNSNHDPYKHYIKNKLETAVTNGIKTIVLTVDSPSYLKRERYLKVGDNYWMTNIQPTLLNPCMDWLFVEWIVDNYCKKYELQLLLKGIGSGEDALKAYHLDCVAGVILSNHGGRQGECVRSSIEVLIETMAIFNQNNINIQNEDGFEIFVDGGIRRGTDIFKALCLGASAVGIGRPVIYGLACYGQTGVEKIIDIFRDELISCMQRMGVTNIKQIKRNMVCYKQRNFHSGMVPRNESRYNTYSRTPKL
eukprot:1051352_1